MPAHQRHHSTRPGEATTTATKRPPLTHFLCIPLVTPESRPQLETSLATFVKDISASDLGREKETRTRASGDVDGTLLAKAIRPIGSLHLTLGVMSLTTENRVREAVEFLEMMDLASLHSSGSDTFETGGMSREEQGMIAGASREATSVLTEASKSPSEQSTRKVHPSLKKPISPPPTKMLTDQPATTKDPDPTSPAKTPITISLHSLKTMRSPTQTTVLYATPTDPKNRLLPIAETARTLFTEKGFLIKEERPLKLHATVLNTIYIKGDRNSGQGVGKTKERRKNQSRISFNATDLIERYSGFCWADEIVIDRVCICRMGALKVFDARKERVIDEVYEEIGSRSLFL